MKPHSNGGGARKRTLTLSTGPMAVDTFMASNRCYWPRGPVKPANDQALTVYQLTDLPIDEFGYGISRLRWRS